MLPTATRDREASAIRPSRSSFSACNGSNGPRPATSWQRWDRATGPLRPSHQRPLAVRSAHPGIDTYRAVHAMSDNSRACVYLGGSLDEN